MAAAPALWQTGWELLCCLYLGGLVGALRALAPGRGRGAVLPDLALVGMLLLFLQSYAAGYSAAGTLRWYMGAAGFAGALAAHALLDPLTGRLRRALLRPLRRLRHGLLCPRFVSLGPAAPQNAQKRRQKIKKRACQSSRICCIIQTCNSTVAQSSSIREAGQNGTEP